jgi:hypothetical protein
VIEEQHFVEPITQAQGAKAGPSNAALRGKRKTGQRRPPKEKGSQKVSSHGDEWFPQPVFYFWQRLSSWHVEKW